MMMRKIVEAAITMVMTREPIILVASPQLVGATEGAVTSYLARIITCDAQRPEHSYYR